MSKSYAFQPLDPELECFETAQEILIARVEDLGHQHGDVTHLPEGESLYGYDGPGVLVETNPETWDVWGWWRPQGQGLVLFSSHGRVKRISTPRVLDILRQAGEVPS